MRRDRRRRSAWGEGTRPSICRGIHTRANVGRKGATDLRQGSRVAVAFEDRLRNLISLRIALVLLESFSFELHNFRGSTFEHRSCVVQRIQRTERLNIERLSAARSRNKKTLNRGMRLCCDEKLVLMSSMATKQREELPIPVILYNVRKGESSSFETIMAFNAWEFNAYSSLKMSTSFRSEEMLYLETTSIP